MDKHFYHLLTLFESVLGVFGVRTFYDQPRYTVVERLDRGVEIRAYEPRLAVETDGRGQGDGEAFGRLFCYITGSNQRGDRIAMTAPLETGGQRIAMTVPVEQGAGGTMRFFLPRDMAETGAPEPACDEHGRHAGQADEAALDRVGSLGRQLVRRKDGLEGIEQDEHGPDRSGEGVDRLSDERGKVPREYRRAPSAAEAGKPQYDPGIRGGRVRGGLSQALPERVAWTGCHPAGIRRPASTVQPG